MASTTEHSSGRSWREAWAGETLAGDESSVCTAVRCHFYKQSAPALRGDASPGPSPTSTSPQTLLNFIPAGPIFSNPDTALSLSLPGGSSLPLKAPGLPGSKQSPQILPAASTQLESRQLKSLLHPNRHLDMYLLNPCRVPGSRARRQTEALVGGSLLVPHLPLTSSSNHSATPPPPTSAPSPPAPHVHPSCFSPALEGKARGLCSQNAALGPNQILRSSGGNSLSPCSDFTVQEAAPLDRALQRKGDF
ncbi:uncharacterized protein LOC129551107 [Moschus berezovskii]|uniref:uncharacterized protein LOC129551107 n=1 Tax=Moschus berezovskii TaxID=68408 RepID=UPI0024441A95|nr:uncharacterized protein LOC129551107 [Moschus berezovskii]